MSSEAAQKAYRDSGKMSDYQQEVFREVFDRGAVEALRRAAYAFARSGNEYGPEIGMDLERMADEWEAGR